MSKNRKEINSFISWSAVVMWMLLIFLFSSQVADQSHELSSGISLIISKLLEYISGRYSIDLVVLNIIVRKVAHFIIYLILGILVSDALELSSARGRKKIFLTIGICILYAVSDEFHQLFTPGRSGQALDVLIDSTGSVLEIGGIICFK